MNWKRSKISILILLMVLVLGVIALPLVYPNMPTSQDTSGAILITTVPTEEGTVPDAAETTKRAATANKIETQPPTAPPQHVEIPEEGKAYYDLENVVLYLDAYGELPPNYITKKEAQKLGWNGGSVDKYQKGAAIGGDHFGNYENLLPKGNYTECDIDTKGKSRGSKRLVFSADGHYYYSSNHYETFDEYEIVNGSVVRK